MKKRILITALNWGLGHATRCIPIIRHLLSRDIEVIIGSDGHALQLLKEEFPDQTFMTLPAYRIRYYGPNMVWSIARQVPRLLYAIRAEHWVTERLVRQMNISGVISDNRYGCFSRRVPSVILTHQLNIIVPGRALKWLVDGLQKMALGRFSEVWVPDEEGEPNLTGALSHSHRLPAHTRYIGVLSRLQRYPIEREYDVAVVLSGPEPQRSRLEDILMEQAIGLPYRFIFIQGNPSTRKHYYAADHIEVVSHLTSPALNDVLLASDKVVCRSGYSSVMDLANLGKKAVMIPTPGQTEQEYLADFLDRRGAIKAASQSRIDLDLALRELEQRQGMMPDVFSVEHFRQHLDDWLAGIRVSQ